MDPKHERITDALTEKGYSLRSDIGPRPDLGIFGDFMGEHEVFSAIIFDGSRNVDIKLHHYNADNESFGTRKAMMRNYRDSSFNVDLDSEALEYIEEDKAFEYVFDQDATSNEIYDAIFALENELREIYDEAARYPKPR